MWWCWAHTADAGAARNITSKSSLLQGRKLSKIVATLEVRLAKGWINPVAQAQSDAGRGR